MCYKISQNHFKQLIVKTTVLRKMSEHLKPSLGTAPDSLESPVGILTEAVRRSLSVGELSPGRPHNWAQRESNEHYYRLLTVPNSSADRRRAYLDAATGVGKTKWFWDIARHFFNMAREHGLGNDFKIIAAEPTVTLLGQTRDELISIAPELADAVGVCGDGKKDFNKPFIVGSYDWLIDAVESGQLDGKKVFLIGDEGHHLLSTRRQDLINDRLGDAIHLAVTASASYDANKTLERTHRNRIHKIGLKYAIERGGLLSDYLHIQQVVMRLLPSSIDGSDVDLTTSDFTLLKRRYWIDFMNNAYATMKDGVSGENLSDKTAIFYAADTRHADALANALNSNPILRQKAQSSGLKAVATSIHTIEMSGAEQNARFKDFLAGKYMAVVGDEKFKMGLNHPPVKLIGSYPSASPVVTIQEVGRSTRPFVNPVTGEQQGAVALSPVFYVGNSDPEKDRKARERALAETVTAYKVLGAPFALSPGRKASLKPLVSKPVVTRRPPAVLSTQCTVEMFVTMDEALTISRQIDAAVNAMERNLTEAQILEWMQATLTKTGKLPSMRDITVWACDVDGQLQEVSGENWSAINQALKNRSRGLSAESAPSLADLKIKHGLSDVRKNLSVNRLTRWIKATKSKTGQYPAQADAIVWDQTEGGEFKIVRSESWRAIDNALRNGYRGSRNENFLNVKSLSDFKIKNNFVDDRALSETQIVKWLATTIEKTGKIPSILDQDVWTKNSNSDFEVVDGETWVSIDSAIRGKTRGLSKNGQPIASSLADLKKKHGFVEDKSLSENQIIAWILSTYKKTGKYPSMADNDVWTEISNGNFILVQDESWSKIDSALNNKQRGLVKPDNTAIAESLADLKARNKFFSKKTDLTEEEIVSWMNATKAKTGIFPTATDRDIWCYSAGDNTFKLIADDTWRTIDQAIIHKRRGLVKNGVAIAKSLADLKRKHGLNEGRADRRAISVPTSPATPIQYHEKQDIAALVRQTVSELFSRPLSEVISQLSGDPIEGITNAVIERLREQQASPISESNVLPAQPAKAKKSRRKRQDVIERSNEGKLSEEAVAMKTSVPAPPLAVEPISEISGQTNTDSLDENTHTQAFDENIGDFADQIIAALADQTNSSGAMASDDPFALLAAELTKLLDGSSVEFSEEVTSKEAVVIGQSKINNPHAELTKRLGYEFSTQELLQEALIHPSLAGSEARTMGKCPPFERLEFLGDRVLGLAIADALYKSHPGANEGELARRFNALVNRDALHDVAVAIDLKQHIRMAFGNEVDNDHKNLAVLSDAVEALMGALYLDGGLPPVREFIHNYWQNGISATEVTIDPKTLLQDWAQKQRLALPNYKVVEQTGPAHAPIFTVEVSVKGRPPVTAEGHSKQEAEKAAAGLLLQQIPDFSLEVASTKNTEGAKKRKSVSRFQRSGFNPDINELTEHLGYRFTSKELLLDALTHPSVGEKHPVPYERLEFLGDRVLGLVVADCLYSQYPEINEGELAKRHTALVNREALRSVADKIDLSRHLRLAQGEEASVNRRNAAALPDAMEAIIGALYLDGGIEPASQFILRHWQEGIAAAEVHYDPKTVLQEWAQEQRLPLPSYEVLEQLEVAHAPIFIVAVSVKGHPPVNAEGYSKRAAEKKAAELLLQKITNKAQPTSQASERNQRQPNTRQSSAGSPRPQKDTPQSLRGHVFLMERAPQLRMALESRGISTRGQLLMELVNRGLNHEKVCDQLLGRFLEGKILKNQQSEPVLTSTAKLICEIAGINEVVAYGAIAPHKILKSSPVATNVAAMPSAEVATEEVAAMKFNDTTISAPETRFVTLRPTPIDIIVPTERPAQPLGQISTVSTNSSATAAVDDINLAGEDNIDKLEDGFSDAAKTATKSKEDKLYRQLKYTQRQVIKWYLTSHSAINVLRNYYEQLSRMGDSSDDFASDTKKRAGKLVVELALFADDLNKYRSAKQHGTRLSAAENAAYENVKHDIAKCILRLRPDAKTFKELDRVLGDITVVDNQVLDYARRDHISDEEILAHYRGKEIAGDWDEFLLDQSRTHYEDIVGLKRQLRVMHARSGIPAFHEFSTISRHLSRTQQKVINLTEQFIADQSTLIDQVCAECIEIGLIADDIRAVVTNALMDAVQSHSTHSGVDFTSYAISQIKYSTERATTDLQSSPDSLDDPQKLNEIRRASRKVFNETGHYPSATVLAEKLDIPLGEIQDLLILLKEEVSSSRVRPRQLRAEKSDEKPTAPTTTQGLITLSAQTAALYAEAAATNAIHDESGVARCLSQIGNNLQLLNGSIDNIPGLVSRQSLQALMSISGLPTSNLGLKTLHTLNAMLRANPPAFKGWNYPVTRLKEFVAVEQSSISSLARDYMDSWVRITGYTGPTRPDDGKPQETDGLQLRYTT